MTIREGVSYSSYRGITDRSRYDAVDDYFRYEVDGNIICTDDEKDISHDGNIILLTPEDDAVIIGSVPRLESGAGKPRFRLDGKELHCEYKVFYDNDHHHAGWEEEVIDCSFEKWEPQIRKNKLMLFLSQKLKACSSGSLRNSFDITDYSDSDQIDINVDVVRYGYMYMTKDSNYYTIVLRPNDSGQYEIVDSEDTPAYKDAVMFYDGSGIGPVQKALEKFYAEPVKEQAEER